MLYGLWLYGDRTGDWETIRKCWDKIASYYKGSIDGPILYGQMSGHIAMARLARQFGDETMLKLASEALEKDFDLGQRIDAIERRVQKTRFARFYDARNQRAFPGQPWLILDASPEVMRFSRTISPQK